MTYPNENPRRDPVRTIDKDATPMWITGILGVGLVLALVFWAANRNPDTAMTDTRPNATTPATTTGSGASPSTIPNATTPKKDNEPAPGPRAPAAR